MRLAENIFRPYGHCMIDQSAMLESVENRAKGLNLSMNKVCEKAKVPYSTYFRWREGVQSPTIKNLNKLLGAIDTLEKDMRERLA